MLAAAGEAANLRKGASMRRRVSTEGQAVGGVRAWERGDPPLQEGGEGGVGRVKVVARARGIVGVLTLVHADGVDEGEDTAAGARVGAPEGFELLEGKACDEGGTGGD